MADNNNNYSIQQMHVNLMWEKGYTGEGITVGIVDTGVDVNHPMIKDHIVAGQNFSDDGLTSTDLSSTNYHGTAVSALVCGDYINHRVYGIAPKSKIVIGKALNNAGRGGYEAITNAINYCVAQGVDIINCSIGCEADSDMMKNAVVSAVKKGIPVVVASGNEGHNDVGDIREISYPSAYPESICVGAMDVNYKVADFSNTNEYVDVIAPGVNVLTAYSDGTQKGLYAFCDGTSFACPIIAGCMAILKQKFRIDYQRDPSESELYAQLIKYTRYIQGYNTFVQGNGFIDFSINKIRK